MHGCVIESTRRKLAEFRASIAQRFEVVRNLRRERWCVEKLYLYSVYTVVSSERKDNAIRNTLSELLTSMQYCLATHASSNCRNPWRQSTRNIYQADLKAEEKSARVRI